MTVTMDSDGLLTVGTPHLRSHPPLVTAPNLPGPTLGQAGPWPLVMSHLLPSHPASLGTHLDFIADGLLLFQVVSGCKQAFPKM